MNQMRARQKRGLGADRGNPMKMALTKENEVVGTLPAYESHEALLGGDVSEQR